MRTDGDKWMNVKFNLHYITSRLPNVLQAQQHHLTTDGNLNKNIFMLSRSNFITRKFIVSLTFS